MEIKRSVDQMVVEGPAENFTGRVTIRGGFQRKVPPFTSSLTLARPGTRIRSGRR